jgi:hypothetical protein
MQFQEGEKVKVKETGEEGVIQSAGILPSLGECYKVSFDDIRWVIKTVDELEKFSSVEKPKHYNQDGEIECIDAIRAALGEEFASYCLGNVIKYTWRYKYKNGIEDLKKAQVYLRWAVDFMEDKS